MNRANGWQRGVLDALRAPGALPLTEARWARATGSSLNETWRLDTAVRRYFVKVNEAARLPMLEAEAEGLSALAATGSIRVPVALASGVRDGRAFVVLEHLELGRGACAAALGRSLAALHRATGPAFGWHRDNTIGTTPQHNAWCDDWCEFWRTRRLRPQLELAARHGHGGALERLGDALCERLPAFFEGHAPRPSLLHGDLWGGNWGCLADGAPVLFDPAVYHGDREADLAMTELFGGFPPAFRDAYEEAWPLDAGYAERRDLYNLYHVLNHLNLFGGAYRAQAEALLGSLLRTR